MEPQLNQFIGCDKPFDDAKVVLFGAPYDSTTSFRPGTRFGPEARRGVVGSSEQHDLRIFERTVASYELVRLGFHVVYARNGSSSFRMSRT